jgi:hypothetical protein
MITKVGRYRDPMSIDHDAGLPERFSGPHGEKRYAFYVRPGGGEPGGRVFQSPRNHR